MLYTICFTYRYNFSLSRMPTLIRIHLFMYTKWCKDAVIVSMARTVIGKFGGPMSALSGPKLGAIAIREALARAPGTVSSFYVCPVCCNAEVVHALQALAPRGTVARSRLEAAPYTSKAEVKSNNPTFSPHAGFSFHVFADISCNTLAC